MDLVVRDTSRLLLSRAIEYGLKNNVFDGSFVDELREQGAAMTVKIAGDFYNVNYEAYLRESADIVMGVCNLGAILWGGNDPQKVAMLLQQNSLVLFFRKGFTAIKELFNKGQQDGGTSNYAEDIKNFTKEMMVIKGEEWSGYESYCTKKQSVDKDAKERSFIEWFVRNYCKQIRSTDHTRYDNIVEKNINLSERNNRWLKTGITSMLIHDTPKLPLSVEDVEELSHILIDDFNGERILERITKFETVVPKEYIEFARVECDKIINDLEEQSHGRRNSFLDIMGYFGAIYGETLLLEQPDKSFCRLLLKYKNIVKKEDLIKQIKFYEKTLHGYESEYIDTIYDILFSLDGIELSDIVKIIRSSNGWEGKINWSLLSIDDICQLIIQEENCDSDSSIVHESMVDNIIEDLLKFAQKRYDDQWWNDLPLELLDRMTKDSEENTYILSKRRTLLSADIIGQEFSGNEFISYLLDDDEYYDYSLESHVGEEDRIFVTLVNVMKKNKIDEYQIVDKLCSVISAMVTKISSDTEATKDDEIFYDAALHDAVSSALVRERKIFDKVKQKLSIQSL